MHRKLNASYFSSRTGLDKTEQATDPLFWKPFSYKTGRVRSLTELYLRKNQSPLNSNPDHLQNKLNEIYCMPKRPPLPVRYKKRQLNINNNDKTNESSLNESFSESNYQQANESNYLKPVEYTNLNEVYTVRDASVGPNSSINYGEKEIQTSLEDFHDLDYENELDYHQIFKDDSPSRFIDSSTNDEFECLAKTRNLSDNEDKKIKKTLSRTSENDNVLDNVVDNVLDDFDEDSEDKKEVYEFEFEKEIKIVEFKVEQPKQVQIIEYKELENKAESKMEMINENLEVPHNIGKNLEDSKNLEENLKILQSAERNLEDTTNLEENEETLNDSYVTVKEENTITNRNTSSKSTSSRTIGPYLDAKQDNTLTDDKSNYLTLENYDLDVDKKEFDTDTLADLDSLAEASLTGYETPMQTNTGNSSNRSSIIKPKRTKRKNQMRNSGLDTEDDEDELTDEIIGIAANLQKELKQLVEKENQK